MSIHENISVDEDSDDSPFFYLDEIQSNLYKLLSLFYSGIGIIQRDSPPENQRADPDVILRLENNIKEIIGQFITTRQKLIDRISKLESEKSSFSCLPELLQKTRDLDVILEIKMKKLQEELPLLTEVIDELVDEIGQI
ncbi:hypothetical protein NEAUS04_1028 [Nematocida ausubeli]|nr:hypothetical protein NEAUS07_1297 [Nematocida ausubeli]KAI5150368.1 hypothetical protein NEAUS05_2142 [Nematocida ausubeli]KAI5162570.1 hypothetical protein NEAUS04_1028 [Nematocida ausubeli]